MKRSKYKFSVDGYPPKKDGASSMWGKDTEFKRLVELRLTTLQAMNGQKPLKSDIKLNLKIYVGQVNDKSTGDLDNFITGICDGLMAAAKRSSLHEDWDKPEYIDIHPRNTIAIVDDSQVISIQAEKVTEEANNPHYVVTIEGNE